MWFDRFNGMYGFVLVFVFLGSFWVLFGFGVEVLRPGGSEAWRLGTLQSKPGCGSVACSAAWRWQRGGVGVVASAWHRRARASRQCAWHRRPGGSASGGVARVRGHGVGVAVAVLDRGGGSARSRPRGVETSSLLWVRHD